MRDEWDDNPFAESFKIALWVIVAPFVFPALIARAVRWGYRAWLDYRTSRIEQVTPLVEHRSPWDALADDDQRAVFAALVKLGRPAKNIELAQAMGVSAAESSKRVTALNGLLVRERVGREVRVSLPKLN